MPQHQGIEVARAQEADEQHRAVSECGPGEHATLEHGPAHPCRQFRERRERREDQERRQRVEEREGKSVCHDSIRISTGGEGSNTGVELPCIPHARARGSVCHPGPCAAQTHGEDDDCAPCGGRHDLTRDHLDFTTYRV